MKVLMFAVAVLASASWSAAQTAPLPYATAPLYGTPATPATLPTPSTPYAPLYTAPAASPSLAPRVPAIAAPALAMPTVQATPWSRRTFRARPACADRG